MKPHLPTETSVSKTILSDLGWDRSFSLAFDTLNNKALTPGRVSIEHNHMYRVLTHDGELLAETAGRLKHHAATQSELPAVGDWVALAKNESGRNATIKSVLPTQSCFTRKAAGDQTTQQVVAANINIVLIVSGLDHDFNPRRIGRYLVATSESGAKPVVVLNKVDLHDNLDACIGKVREVAPQVAIHATSCHTSVGIDVLSEYLQPGKTIALLGSSGVGKSSIINKLLGEERQKTRTVRKSDGRGRHTTIHRELIVRPQGGIIIDTPGMRELAVWDSHQAIENSFTEIESLANRCRFRDCSHQTEPGCAVREAIDKRELQPKQLMHYHEMLKERSELDARRIELDTIVERRQNRNSARSTRSRGRRL